MKNSKKVKLVKVFVLNVVFARTVKCNTDAIICNIGLGHTIYQVPDKISSRNLFFFTSTRDNI